jgi:hypothetical protein
VATIGFGYASGVAAANNGATTENNAIPAAGFTARRRSSVVAELALAAPQLPSDHSRDFQAERSRSKNER